MCSFFEIPKEVLKKLDHFRSRFFWQGSEEKKKYRLTKWNVICRPRDQGGLGVLDLEVQNKCMLSKWIFKLFNEDGMWQQMLRNKYLANKTLTQVQAKPGDSHFWSGLMRVKSDFFNYGGFILKNGSQIRYWEDKWLDNTPLKDQYPSLYNIVRRKNDTVATILQTGASAMSFRRYLTGPNLNAWQSLSNRLSAIHLTEETDSFKWELNQNGIFTVSSMYNTMINSHILPNNPLLWKIKVPLKVKIFLWLLYKKVILTKDNLARKNWKGNKKCCFCNLDENIHHLFFDCPFAKFIWRVISIAFNIQIPESTSHVYGAWFTNFDASIKYQMLVGTGAICWAIWFSRNDYVFNKAKILTPM